MRTILNKTVFAVALFGASMSQALANGWEVWAEKQGGDRLTIVASFGGDGQIEEAHLDLNLKGSFEVIDTQTLWKGSVCVASAEKNILRAVPPSGAGKALKASMAEACMFTVRITSKKGWAAEDMIGVSLHECASSVKGIVPCEAAVRVIK